MKNWIGLLITIILLITATLIATIIHNQNNEHFKEITISEYLEETKDLSDLIVYIDNSNYKNDVEFRKIIKLIAAENNITIYHIDTKDISNDDYSKVLSVVVLEKSPTLAIIKDNEVVEKITDTKKTKPDIEEKLEQYEFIKKEP